MEKLTRQEEDVMQVVWRLGNCTVREVLAQMGEPSLPYTTVASVMG
ncbi:MAG: BlaI/MecI/CopY family transcriptional regulator, partial [Bacteroidales bacterium]|nr:BlaI/MecI/CopY family transcriptional regulator [Bacteroidales bacterium]